jgi:serine/threonine protein kinase
MHSGNLHFNILTRKMPFFYNGDMDKFLKERREKMQYFSELELIGFMVQIASAVAFLHSHMLMHRDLKVNHLSIAVVTS